MLPLPTLFATLLLLPLSGCLWEASGEARSRVDPTRLGETAPDGQELFTHSWLPGDALSAFGDGLGPVYNGVSCAGCHGLGGVGGAGGEESNVVLLDGAVLNGGGVDPDYSAWRELRWDQAIVSQLLPRPTSTRALLVRTPVTISHRQTPALFGDGLLDLVADETLLALAAQPDPSFPEVHSRVARTADGRVGRFGWKGDIASLSDFVAGACAGELGLQVPGAPQPAAPQDPFGQDGGRLDLEAAQVAALTDFVAALPPPIEDAWSASAEEGRGLFAEVGCAACHRARLGEVQGAPIQTCSSTTWDLKARTVLLPMAARSRTRGWPPWAGKGSPPGPGSGAPRRSGGSRAARPTCTTALPRASSTPSAIMAERPKRPAIASSRCRRGSGRP